MRYFLLFWLIGWAFLPAFPQTIASTRYAFNQVSVNTHTGYQERTLLEGATRDFSHLLVQAITLQPNQPDQPTQQLDEEVMLIVKTGELTLTLGGKHKKKLGPADVAIIMPGDDYQIENKADQFLTYYCLHYTSNEVPDLDIYQLMGGSYWVNWQEITPTANSLGSSRRPGGCSSVMSSRMAIELTTLRPGLARYPPQAHRAAEILVILDHPVQVQIDGNMNRAEEGDLVFVESDVPHRIQNSSQEGSTYLSLQF